ncbi:kinase domain protein [Rhizoctonia solani AG-3 Rhs1AP]|uniref:non-specific serine/threonine protein kinase n=1 Tax=Rhizoctonia solani AG-3 Rhs1AP TaxID=1086054 RepID=A0A0A1UJ65_9AGAM|nr:kinase domain protein [Rhizoctonia solani AG-3 Rhs1AP]
METETTIQKGIQLGSGGFGRVFRAVQSDTKRVVALKQCRAPLRLKRPPLHYEANVLRTLSGHPSIPEVYAYGRIEHFELLSMQLLHQSLGDVVKEGRPLGVKVVANVASQMIDALEHVHSHGLVHRDIKPDNIMLKSADSWTLCLIDFGLTHPTSNSRVSIKPTPQEESKTPDKSAYLFGTLPFATQLVFRDDLESLAYTLLWLIRGYLPWSHYTKCGSRVSRIRQVFAQKKRHTGLTMAPGLPAEFAELVDYARSLSLDAKPEYNEWKRRFQQVEELATEKDAPTSQPQTPETSVARPEPPMEVGQVVLVKLDTSTTGDGYTIREGHEASFIPDPFFDGPDWITTYRPAVVAQVEWDDRAGKYSFLAIAISRSLDIGEGATTKITRIPIASSHTSGASPRIYIEPGWPLNDSYFYVYKRPVKFYCLPSQERLHSTWRISSSDCDALLDELTPPPEEPPSLCTRYFKSLDSDIRHDARMKRWAGYCKLYAQVQPLTRTHLDDNSIDWFSKRAWFDECVRIQRHKNLHGGFWWTGAWFSSAYHPKEGDVEDSYMEPEYSTWRPQEERNQSLTLPGEDKDVNCTSERPLKLTKIIGLQQDSAQGARNHCE